MSTHWYSLTSLSFCRGALQWRQHLHFAFQGNFDELFPHEMSKHMFILSLYVQYIVWLQQFCLPKQAVSAQCASQIAWLTSRSPARTLFHNQLISVTRMQSIDISTVMLSFSILCSVFWQQNAPSNWADAQKLVKWIDKEREKRWADLLSTA